MTHFDIAVILIILISTLLALFRGFLRELFSLIVWAGAAALTLFFYPYVKPLMAAMWKSTLIVNISSVVCTFVVIFIMLSIIATLLIDFTRGARDGVIDRLFGGIFGFLRGALLVSLIHFSVVKVQGKAPVWLEKSDTYPFTKMGADFINANVEKYLKDIKIGPDDEKVKEDIDKMKEESEDVGDNVKENVKSDVHSASDSVTKAVNGLSPKNKGGSK